MATARQGGLVSTPITSTNTSGIPVQEILPHARIIGNSGEKSLPIESCCGHWEDVQKGDLYVAVVGSQKDGHDHAAAAIAKGATAVVTERLLAIDAPQIIVPDTRQAYGEICHRLAGTPSTRLTTIGISGSDGKTVTAHLVHSILKADSRESGLVSSIEVSLGKNTQSVPNRHINPPLIAEQFSRMVMHQCDHAVVEIPSQSLAKRALSGIELDVAVLTNIRHDPDNFHGNGKNYRRAFLRIIDHLKDTGLAVLNADDPKSHFLIEKLDSPVLTVGMRQDANVKAFVIERTVSDQVFMIHAGGASVPVRTDIIGDHHIYNCLAATAVGLSLGISLQTIAKGLESAGSIPGRMERVECGQPFGVWVDSANSPSQLANALRTMKQVTKGKVWCVCSTDPLQSEHQRRLLGEVSEKAANATVITRTSADPMVDYEPIHQVLDGFRKPESAQIIPNRFKAIEWVLSQAKTGDAVLISGCGERPFALVGEHHWTIADRDVCQAWLYDNASMIQENCEQPPSIYNIDDYRS